jgi:hypothetical protein
MAGDGRTPTTSPVVHDCGPMRGVWLGNSPDKPQTQGIGLPLFELCKMGNHGGSMIDTEGACRGHTVESGHTDRHGQLRWVAQVGGRAT